MNECMGQRARSSGERNSEREGHPRWDIETGLTRRELVENFVCRAGFAAGALKKPRSRHRSRMSRIKVARRAKPPPRTC